MAVAPERTAGPELGLSEQEHEIELDRLPVEGEIPSWLTGSLVRVTPA